MRRQQRSAAGLPAAIALVALLAACGPLAPDSARPAEPETVIQVHHDLAVATSLTIEIIDPASNIRRLGTVSAGEIRSFELTERPAGGDYRLVAEFADGRSLVSPRFPLRGRLGVEWSLSLNRVLPILP